MTTVSEAFARAKSENRAALIGYLPAGFPDRDTSVALMQAMVEEGVDIIEVGLPYSDPLMDGPVIQEAAAQALSGGTTTDDVLSTVDRIADSSAATVVMSYWNPIERYGVERFSQRLAEAGGSGVITPDLTPEEAGPWRQATDNHGLDRIFLVAPSSTPARITVVTEACSGFIYAASVMGVTGARSQAPVGADALVERIRVSSDLPVAVGLGVSTGEQAAAIAQYANGVIVGSAFIRAVLTAPDRATAQYEVRKLAAELALGVRRRTGVGHLDEAPAPS
jgi:tryptophan synthase alpha chain